MFYWDVDEAASFPHYHSWCLRPKSLLPYLPPSRLSSPCVCGDISQSVWRVGSRLDLGIADRGKSISLSPSGLSGQPALETPQWAALHKPVKGKHSIPAQPWWNFTHDCRVCLYRVCLCVCVCVCVSSRQIDALRPMGWPSLTSPYHSSVETYCNGIALSLSLSASLSAFSALFYNFLSFSSSRFLSWSIPVLSRSPFLGYQDTAFTVRMVSLSPHLFLYVRLSSICDSFQETRHMLHVTTSQERHLNVNFWNMWSFMCLNNKLVCHL